MHIPLDREQDVPLYLQIEEALRRAILTGVFVDGDKLPSTRTLAAELAVSRLTVDNAYAELAARAFASAARRLSRTRKRRRARPGRAAMLHSRWRASPPSPHGWTATPTPRCRRADQLRRRRRQP